MQHADHDRHPYITGSFQCLMSSFECPYCTMRPICREVRKKRKNSGDKIKEQLGAHLGSHAQLGAVLAREGVAVQQHALHRQGMPERISCLQTSLTYQNKQKAPNQAACTHACSYAYLAQVAYALLCSVCDQVTTPDDLSQAVLGALGNLQAD